MPNLNAKTNHSNQLKLQFVRVSGRVCTQSGMENDSNLFHFLSDEISSIAKCLFNTIVDFLFPNLNLERIFFLSGKQRFVK